MPDDSTKKKILLAQSRGLKSVIKLNRKLENPLKAVSIEEMA